MTHNGHKAGPYYTYDDGLLNASVGPLMVSSTLLLAVGLAWIVQLIPYPDSGRSATLLMQAILAAIGFLVAFLALPCGWPGVLVVQAALLTNAILMAYLAEPIANVEIRFLPGRDRRNGVRRIGMRSMHTGGDVLVDGKGARNNVQVTVTIVDAHHASLSLPPLIAFTRIQGTMNRMAKPVRQVRSIMCWSPVCPIRRNLHVSMLMAALASVLSSGCMDTLNGALAQVEGSRPSEIEVHLEPDTLTDQITVTVTRTVHDPYRYEYQNSGGSRLLVTVHNESGEAARLYKYGGHTEYTLPASGARTMQPGVHEYTFHWNGRPVSETSTEPHDPHSGERVAAGQYTVRAQHMDIDFLQANATVVVLDDAAA